MRRPNDASAFRNVYLRPDSRECPSCGRPREFLWNGQRYVRFVGDRVRIDYHVYVCTNGECPLPGIHVKPEAVTMHVLPGREFGLDVIALIGYCRLGMSLSFPKIARTLPDVHGVEISRREVEADFDLLPERIRTRLRQPKTSAGEAKAPRKMLSSSEYYGGKLLTCYDHEDIPRTNNGHEHMYGRLRGNERRGALAVGPLG